MAQAQPSPPPQPAAYYPPPPPQGFAPLQMQGAGKPAQWTTGLCDCFDDVGNCILTYFCPCVTFGRIAEIVDKGASTCPSSACTYCCWAVCCGSCLCVYTKAYRAKLRGDYGLPETPCPDMCVHWCCHNCALCQEYRELQNRGFVMNKGWNGNLRRQQASAAPPVQAMAR